MYALSDNGILYAVSVTVTKQNLSEVVTEEYLSDLREKGCGAVFFVEYVPAEKGTEGLVLSDEEADLLNEKVKSLKQKFRDMSVFAFPGDEKYMGGCLAAGRGFFHINPFGGAEACPFSPYSKLNVRENTILEILASDFFGEIRKIGKAGTEQHIGGCTLFNHKKEILQLL